MIDWTLLAPEHVKLIRDIVGSSFRLGDDVHLPREPNEVLTPEGTPYIYRWHVVPRRLVGANVYLHLQVADDPERPLHDHPWDNQSVILAGGYIEVYQQRPPRGPVKRRTLRVGDVAQRRAAEAHRLYLIPGNTLSISLFSTGPVIREWGFWKGGKWIDYVSIREIVGGQDRVKEGALA